ncbi:interactor of HORMAD1 protein 1 [Cebidichthys violaceus]|uniref:interactor of HORMAD1 protein 1 n=1 Tax=Cebidichthys violaceus TaxID=271503 RepID=UPI0035CA4EBE
MNHSRNIKEMLGLPTGSRNVATSGYSSFTDSQLFFGSQFWPENSQGLSQDMSLSSRTSQQSSQEGSDPKLSSSYHTKPFLFGELKDKRKTSGILDTFEEDKKKAKEKTDGEILAKECNHFRETLNNIQQLVTGTERNTAACQTILKKFDNFASTLQNNVSSLQSDISLQFETLLNKVNSQKEMITELEESAQKRGDITAELGSNLQSLQSTVESLRKEQARGRNMLEEALKLHSALVSKHSAQAGPERGTDNASQTSPELGQPSSAILQDNKLEGMQLRRKSHNAEHAKAEVPPQHPSYAIKKKSTLRGHKKRQKRSLVLSQRRKCAVTNENRDPLVNCDEQETVSTSPCERQDPNALTSQESLNPDCLKRPNWEMRSIAEGCFITPLSCWSPDSNGSVCLAGIESILEKLSAEPERGTLVKPQSLWQLFD